MAPAAEPGPVRPVLDTDDSPHGSLPKLTAVIVTYNNAAMLANVLEDLGRQTLKLHEIIVIDNSDRPAAQVVLDQKFTSVVFVPMPQNVGTAGGFREGLRRAVPHCDFVLTLDDDVRMQADSLAELYRGYLELKKENRRLGAVRAVGARHGRAAPCRLDDFAWRGTLISAEAIRRVGLPLPDYFMYADDVEFSMQLADQGYEIFDIPGSKIMEQRTGDKLSRRILGRRVICYEEDFRFYYSFRNSIHACKKHRRHRALIRNLLYALKLLPFFGLFHRTGGWHRLRAIGRGVLDGMRSRLGKNNCYLPGAVQPTSWSSRPARGSGGKKIAVSKQYVRARSCVTQPVSDSRKNI